MQILKSKLHQDHFKPIELTIAIPTWNRAEQLHSQLEKIALTFGSQIEIVVCDNGSQDGTWELLKEEVSRNRLMLTCLRNPTNLGTDANVLRALEASTGEWTWQIGDDECLDFASLHPDLMPLLSMANTNLILLTDQGALAATEGTITEISVEEFFDPSLDHLGGLLHLSRIICRTIPASKHLAWAYKNGMGSLHAHCFIYGKLFADSGLETIFTRGLFLDDPNKHNHRWDRYEAHSGAWRTNLLIFKQHKKLARARERRVRSPDLYHSTYLRIYNNAPLGSSFLFVIRELPLKYRIKIVLHYLRMASRRRSTRKVRSASEPSSIEY